MFSAKVRHSRFLPEWGVHPIDDAEGTRHSGVVNTRRVESPHVSHADPRPRLGGRGFFVFGTRPIRSALRNAILNGRETSAGCRWAHHPISCSRGGWLNAPGNNAFFRAFVRGNRGWLWRVAFQLDRGVATRCFMFGKPSRHKEEIYVRSMEGAFTWTRLSLIASYSAAHSSEPPGSRRS